MIKKYVKKICLWSFILLVFLMFAVPGATTLFTGGGRESVAPQFIDVTESERSLNMEFSQQFDDYFSENFGLRDYLVTAYAKLHLTLFSQSANKEVVVGKDEWLFFSETTDDYTGESAVDDRMMFRMSKTIELMDEYLERYGVTMVFFSAPNKNSIYPEYMPSSVYRTEEPSNLDRLSEAMKNNNAYIDMKAELLKAKEDSKVPLYRQYDSHWNNVGALKAFDIIEANLNSRIAGFEYVDFNKVAKMEKKRSEGDLSEMLLPEKGLTDTDYSLWLPQKYSFVNPMYTEMDPEILTTCAERYYSAICYRDSFFNALIDPFANAFSKTRFTRALPYDLTAATDGNYYVVIVELVERNLYLLLQNAPIALAPQREKPDKIIDSGCETQLCEFSDNGDTISLNGVFGDWAEIGTTDCVYIEMRGENNSSFFEAYPITEGDAFNNCGFSAQISKHSLIGDNYTAYVHVGDSDQTTCAKLCS